MKKRVDLHCNRLNAKQNLFCFLPWIVLAAEFLWIVIRYYLVGMNYLNSDMTGEMLLANTLNSEGSFAITNNFCYSTELHVVYTQFVNQLALMLFSDWHVARTFSIAVCLLLLLISYFYFAHVVKLKNHGILAAILMLIPFSADYNWIVIIGSCYTAYLILGFVTISLVFRCMELSEAGNEKPFAVRVALLLVISFLAGLNGIRHLLSFSFPLFIVGLILFVIKNGSFHDKGSIKKMLHTTYGRMLSFSFLALLFSVLGYLVNHFYFAEYYTFYTYGDVQLGTFSISSLISDIGKLVELFGYTAKSYLMSGAGLKSIAAIIWFVIVCVCLLDFLVHSKEYSIKEKIVVMFSWTTLAISILDSDLSGMNYTRYQTIAFLFQLICISISVPKMFSRMYLLKPLFYIFLLGSMTVSYYYPDWTMLHAEGTASMIPAAEWLDENGYTCGYATFWQSNIVTELTNGKIEMWTMKDSALADDWKELKIYPWLQKKSHLTEKPEGRVFVLLTEEEYETDPSFVDNNVVYQSEGIVILDYESADQLYSYVN